jgi:hypothetical protein
MGGFITANLDKAEVCSLIDEGLELKTYLTQKEGKKK